MTDPRFTPVIVPAQSSHHRYYPYGPFVSITLAQWAVESAYGTAMSGKNNPFGIKATPTEIAVGEATKVWTKEFINGQYRNEDLYFRDYINMEQAFNAHAKLLISHHYLLCMRAKTPEAYAYALRECGYATAPNYAGVLLEVIADHDLTQFDQRF